MSYEELPAEGDKVQADFKAKPGEEHPLLRGNEPFLKPFEAFSDTERKAEGRERSPIVPGTQSRALNSSQRELIGR